MAEELGALQWSITVGDEEARAKLDSFYQYAREISEKIAALKPQLNLGTGGQAQYGVAAGASDRPVGPAPITEAQASPERISVTPETIRDAIDRGIGEATVQRPPQEPRVVGPAEVRQLPTGYTEVPASSPVAVQTRDVGASEQVPPPIPPSQQSKPLPEYEQPEIREFVARTLEGITPTIGGKKGGALDVSLFSPEQRLDLAQQIDPSGYIKAKQSQIDAQLLAASEEELSRTKQVADARGNEIVVRSKLTESLGDESVATEQAAEQKRKFVESRVVLAAGLPPPGFTHPESQPRAGTGAPSPFGYTGPEGQVPPPPPEPPAGGRPPFFGGELPLGLSPGFGARTGLVGSFLGFGAIREGIRAITSQSEYLTELATAGSDQQAILEANLRRRDQLTRGGLVGRFVGFVEDPSGSRRAAIDLAEQRSKLEENRTELVAQIKSYTDSFSASAAAALAGPGRGEREIRFAELDRQLREHRAKLLEPLAKADEEEITKYRAQVESDIAGHTGEGYEALRQAIEKGEPAEGAARRVVENLVAQRRHELAAARQPVIASLDKSIEETEQAQKRNDEISNKLEALEDSTNLAAASFRSVGLDFQATYQSQLAAIESRLIAAPPERRAVAENIAQQERQALAFGVQRSIRYATEDYQSATTELQAQERGDDATAVRERIERERQNALRNIPHSLVVGPFGVHFDPFDAQRQAANQYYDEQQRAAAQQILRRDQSFSVASSTNIGVAGLRGDRRFQEAELANIYGETEAKAAAEADPSKRATIRLEGEARISEALKRFAHDFEQDVIKTQGVIDSLSLKFSGQPFAAAIARIESERDAAINDLPQTLNPQERATRISQINQVYAVEAQVAADDTNFAIQQATLAQTGQGRQLGRLLARDQIGAESIGIATSGELTAKEQQREFGGNFGNPLLGVSVPGLGTLLGQGTLANSIKQEELLRQNYLDSFHGEALDLRRFNVTNAKDVENPSVVLKEIQQQIDDLKQAIKDLGSN